MREPGIFWAPGRIQPGVVSDLGSTMDLFATISKIAGVALPKDRILDSHDLSPTLFGQKDNTRKSILYYRGTEIYAARLGDFKAHYITQGAYGEFGERTAHETPLLYNLSQDPSEQFDIAQEHPEILIQIQDLVAAHKSNLVAGKDQLADRE